MNIQGIEQPSGRVCTLDECRRRNRYIPKTIDIMVRIATEFANRENLAGVIYIYNRIGATRDECGIGFEYPDDREVEERLNRTFKADRIIDWVKGLPEGEREPYLEFWRNKGYRGYL